MKLHCAKWLTRFEFKRRGTELRLHSIFNPKMSAMVVSQRAPAVAGVLRIQISSHLRMSAGPATPAPRPSPARQASHISTTHAPHASHRGATRIAAGPAGDGAAASPPQPQFGLRQIAGDGRCMFRALAQGAHFCALLDAGQPPAFLAPAAETAAADVLRTAVCDALLAGRDRFEPFIASDEGASFEQYVERMRQARTFGGEPELAVAADVIARPITVFRLEPAARQLTLSSEYLPAEGAAGEDAWPVPLVYRAAGPQSGHYDLLAPMDATEAKAPAGGSGSGLIL